MVDSHYLPRVASGLLERALAASPVVVLMGARQTGKSTLARSEPFLADRLYLTLDDLEIREHARFAAGDLLGRAPRLTLDEVQREPELLLAVKRAVDEDRPRPQRAVPSHRFREPAADAPGLGDARRPGRRTSTSGL